MYKLKFYKASLLIGESLKKNNQFQTKYLRKAVELICRKIKELGGYKKGLAINFDSQSPAVTPRGVEPPTNRTGICHSIQLNYGVINGAVNISTETYQTKAYYVQ